MISAVDPSREISFGFVSCSCRACERAGEAKLWACERGVFVNARGLHSNISSGRGLGFGFRFFVSVAIYVGFKFVSKKHIAIYVEFFCFSVFCLLLTYFLMFLFLIAIVVIYMGLKFFH